jgi:hypothetical protein
MSKLRIKREKKSITSFNDMKTILYMVVGYIGVTKIGINQSLKAFVAYEVIDFIIRLAAITGIFLFKKIIGSSFR